MSRLAEALERLRSLFGRDRESLEMAEEIRFHIDRETEKNVGEGMNPTEARRAALVAFGGVDRWTEQWREARGVGAIEGWVREARLAVRRLFREPSITLPSLITLALGIGASTAVFSLVHAVLIRPLPYPRAHEIVEVGHTTPELGLEQVGQSPGTYEHYRTGNRVFEEVALFIENAVSVSVTDGDTPERVRVALVTSSFFDVIDVHPPLGRAFVEEDMRAAADSLGPVIISHGLWTRRYGADPRVVSGTVELNRTLRHVVGVMPPGFDFPHPDTDVWYANSFTPRSGDLIRDLVLTGIARLRPDVTSTVAAADLTRLLGTLDDSPELAGGDVRPTVTRLRTRSVEVVRRPLLILALTASFLLLVTLANVSGLFLVRAERLGGEVAMARALGAGGHDLRRRFLTEGWLLAALGGGLGTLMAWVGVSLHFGFAPGDLPRLHELGFGGATLAFAALLSLGVGTIIAVVSLLRSRRFVPARSGSTASGRSVGGREWSRIHAGLAAVQIALAMALVVSSVFMVESLVRVSRVDPGFQSAGVLTFRVNPSGPEYLDYTRAATLHRELRDRLLGLPGTTGAEVIAWLPLTGTPSTARDHVKAEGEPLTEEGPPAAFNLASPGYFDLMGIPVLRGTAFGDPIVQWDAPPVVVSASLAQLLFGDGDPIGQRITLPGYARFIELPPYTVIGVVGDVADRTLTEGSVPTLYFPAILEPAADYEGGYPLVPREMVVVVRASMAPLGLVGSVRDIMRELDPKLPVYDVRSLDDLVIGASARMRLVTILLVLAGVTSLCLGLTGVYGIVAYSASLRIGEIGVRVALGSTSSQVVRLVMGGTSRVAAAGLGMGLVAAYILTRLIGSQLYDVNTSSPSVYAAIAGSLLAVVLVAAWIPAHRLSRLDVVDALRRG